MLSALFDKSVLSDKEKIHSCIPLFREQYRQHVRWPSLEEWTNFQGRWNKLPLAVGAIDGILAEIYRLGIEPQEHYYSRNRQYHCIHTRVVMTNHNVLCRMLVSCDIRSMPSSLCLRWIGIDLPFPDDLYLPWDKIYPNRHPIMTPYTRQMIVVEPANL